VKDIYINHGGIKGFYTGLAPTVIRAALLNSTKLGTYDTIKHGIIDNGYMKDGYSC
jgi:Mitochondrial carrier protein